ncbi:MAG: hypothetical protein M3Z32_00650 [Acidobacteriota bacterium]|nr:hypothetical protein [Acidobacteriota bacterium]
MSVIKRRSRFITFRLLESEYEDFRELCATEGARSLSDLARSALLRLKQRGETDGVQVKLDALIETVQELDREIKNLSRLLSDSKRMERQRSPEPDPRLLDHRYDNGRSLD